MSNLLSCGLHCILYLRVNDSDVILFLSEKKRSVHVVHIITLSRVFADGNNLLEKVVEVVVSKTDMTEICKYTRLQKVNICRSNMNEAHVK